MLQHDLPRRSAKQWALALGVAAFCVGLVLYPVVMTIAFKHQHLARIVLFTALTVATIIGGLLAWVGKGRGLRRPAEELHWEVLCWLFVATLLWAMVIVDSSDAAYFLTALTLLASWLLPPLAGVIATTVLAICTVAGQVFHHGLTAGTVVGPVVVAVLIVAFVATIRLLYRSSEEAHRLLVQLRASRAETARAEREAGRLAERARIGRDLHDTVAQSLSSIQLLLQAAQRATDPAQAKAHLALASQAAHDSLVETRAFIGELTPPELATSGLIPALDRLARESTVETKLEVVGEPQPLAARVETALLRIAQEAVHNVEAHATAEHCRVTLTFEASEVVLEIDDDGCGFDAEESAAKGRFGLRAMRSRAEELGGSFALISAPGDGTLVAARVPVGGEQQ